MKEEPYSGPAMFSGMVTETAPGAWTTTGGVVLKVGTPAADEAFLSHEQAWLSSGGHFDMAVNSKLAERGAYDDPLDGDRHYLAKRVAARLGITVLDYYEFFITTKQERAAILSEKGEFAADSLHDEACYVKLLADYIAGK